MLMECQEHLEEIDQNLNEAVKYLRSIFLAMAKLELAGFYPAVPTEEWKNQNGSDDGLYLHFPSKPDGTYLGPDGQRTVYIGTDSKQIAEARRLAENRRRYKQMSAAAQDLDMWLFRYQDQLKVQAIIAKYWPKVEIPEPLLDDSGSQQDRKIIPFSIGG
jgi:hypothetical protein